MVYHWSITGSTVVNNGQSNNYEPLSEPGTRLAPFHLTGRFQSHSRTTNQPTTPEPTAHPTTINIRHSSRDLGLTSYTPTFSLNLLSSSRSIISFFLDSRASSSFTPCLHNISYIRFSVSSATCRVQALRVACLLPQNCIVFQPPAPPPQHRQLDVSTPPTTRSIIRKKNLSSLQLCSSALVFVPRAR